MLTIAAVKQFQRNARLLADALLGDVCNSAMLLAMSERIKMIETQLIDVLSE